MPQNWQTVAIPFAAGIKPTSRGRVLEQTKLLTAQNCMFLTDEGPEKRNGHTSRVVENSLVPPGLDGIDLPGTPPIREPFTLDDPALGEFWLHGFGLMAFGLDDSTAPGAYSVSEQPRLGVLFGGWQRDNEVVAWDGFRALSASLTDSPFGEVSGQAVMPGLRGAPIAKSINGQSHPDAVDNGVVRSAAWVFDNDVYRSVYASGTGAPLVVEQAFGLTGATNVRLVSIGAWTHAVIRDSDIDELLLRSWHQDSPGTVVSRSLGGVDESVFDAKKYDEETGVVARVLDNKVYITLIRDSGQPYLTYDILPIAGSITGSRVAKSVAIALHPTGLLGLLVQNTDFDVIVASYVMDTGVEVHAQEVVVTTSAQVRFTIGANYNNHQAVDAWTVYVEEPGAGTTRLLRSYSVSDIVQLRATRYNTQLGSHAFSVGQRTYIWVAGSKTTFTLQPTWYLCDEKILPVGKVLFGLGLVPDSTNFYLPSVTWHTSSANHAPKDRVVFFGALPYRQRADTSATTGDPNGVWAEPSIFFYTLDFLPRLRSAQAGRSTYIAGAQLWEYDGASLVEAGFNQAPEGYTVGDGGAGNLDETKQYNWRIDLCHKNAQNEEIRSWSTSVSVAANTFGAATYQATITIPHVPMTRRENSYFLVFRTEGDGTEYYLVSSRNPEDANFLPNLLSTNQTVFTDNTSDASLIDNEYHPSNATGWIQPLPAPACEIVAAGRDRLWLAGGELSPGEIAPSRLFFPGETPSFSPALNLQIDRNSEAITAIGFVGEQAVFFRKTSAYTQDSEGPDNVFQGVWAPPRLALSDVGAIGQESLALAGEGLYFQSPAGIRVITQGGGLRPPGAGLVGGLGTDVDSLVEGGIYSAAVVVPKYSQIRWYSRDPEQPSLVVDYTKNVWTTFTGLECAFACYWHPGSKPILLRGNAELWEEEEGRYLDNDRTIEMVVKTAWLHAGSLGDFERIKRFALFGEASDGLNLRYRVYYDERPFADQEDTVEFIGSDPATMFNSSTWGNVAWGTGPWGDEAVEGNSGVGSGLYFRDGVFRFRRRFDRQKCGVFAIEFSDQGSQAAFVPVALAIELGVKPGLDRIPNG